MRWGDDYKFTEKEEVRWVVQEKTTPFVCVFQLLTWPVSKTERYEVVFFFDKRKILLFYDSQPPWATETVLSPWLAADEARVSHVLSHVVWWKKNKMIHSPLLMKVGFTSFEIKLLICFLLVID